MSDGRRCASCPVEVSDREYEAELVRVQNEHLCGCDVCARGGPICPGSAGTLIQELAEKRISARNLVAVVERLREEMAAITEAPRDLPRAGSTLRRAGQVSRLTRQLSLSVLLSSAGIPAKAISAIRRTVSQPSDDCAYCGAEGVVFCEQCNAPVCLDCLVETKEGVGCCYEPPGDPPEGDGDGTRREWPQ